jgi:hypothetical protein
MKTFANKSDVSDRSSTLFAIVAMGIISAVSTVVLIILNQFQ